MRECSETRMDWAGGRKVTEFDERSPRDKILHV